MLFQLSISQSTRRLTGISRGLAPSSTTQKIHSQLKVFDPNPQIVSDQSTLEIASPEFESLHLQLFEYLEDSVIWEQTLWVFPGNQEIPLYLYDLVEGEYTLAIWREEEVVYKYLKIEGL